MRSYRFCIESVHIALQNIFDQAYRIQSSVRTNDNHIDRAYYYY